MARMTKLQKWMTANDRNDAAVGRAIKLDRSQVSRIRRGETGTSQKTALRLETLTGIKWWHFMDRG